MSSLFALQQNYDDSSDSSEFELELDCEPVTLKANEVEDEVKKLMNIILNRVDHHVRFRSAHKRSNSNDGSSESEEEESKVQLNDLLEEEDDDDYADLDGFDVEPHKLPPLKTKGELTLEELPPVEHLHISMNTSQLQQIGRVSAIVAPLVVIQAFRNTPPLNLDSVLFFRDGSAIGTIFDVFGPVVEPNYSIRFNSKAEIASRGITINMPIYFVPNSPAPITEYVFVSELRKLKGSDASWFDNNEPPENVKEYSDDEQERKDRLKSKAKRRHNQSSSHSNQTNSNYFSRSHSNNRQNGRPSFNP